MSVQVGSKGPKIATVKVKDKLHEVIFENGLATVDKAVAKKLVKDFPNNYYFPGKGANSLDLKDPLQVMSYGLNQLINIGQFGKAKNWLMGAMNTVETSIMNADKTQVTNSDEPEHKLTEAEMQSGPTVIRLPDGTEVPINKTDVDGNPVEEEPEEPEEDEDEEDEDEEDEEDDEEEEDEEEEDDDDEDDDELIKRSEKLKKKGKRLSKKNKK